jgi:Uma2 family endonuclease
MTINAATHFFTIHEWRKMGEANIFPPGKRIELINGQILDMAPIGFNHAGHLKRINKLFTLQIPDNLIVSIQDPLQLGNLSEPEPDFILLKPDTDCYTTRHPQANDVLLIIEIADSSLKLDQTEKLRLYALHGIPEYWIVNLESSCLETYRKPQNDTYIEKTILVKGDTVTLSQLPELTIQVSDIL